jgi:hypothetical protein
MRSDRPASVGRAREYPVQVLAVERVDERHALLECGDVRQAHQDDRAGQSAWIDAVAQLLRCQDRRVFEAVDTGGEHQHGARTPAWNTVASTARAGSGRRRRHGEIDVKTGAKSIGVRRDLTGWVGRRIVSVILIIQNVIFEPRLRYMARHKLSMTMLLSAGLIVAAAATATAQPTSAVRGVVLDEQGAAVPGATVVLRQPSSGLERTTISDGQGRFSSPNLPLGRHEVAVELSGFQPRIERV